MPNQIPSNLPGHVQRRLLSQVERPARAFLLATELAKSWKTSSFLEEDNIEQKFLTAYGACEPNLQKRLSQALKRYRRACRQANISPDDRFSVLRYTHLKPKKIPVNSLA